MKGVSKELAFLAVPRPVALMFDTEHVQELGLAISIFSACCVLYGVAVQLVEPIYKLAKECMMHGNGNNILYRMWCGTHMSFHNFV